MGFFFFLRLAAPAAGVAGVAAVISKP